MKNIKEMTVEELWARQDALDAWNAIVRDTWGNAEYHPVYRERREALFGAEYSYGDPDDPLNSVFEIDKELGLRP